MRTIAIISISIMAAAAIALTSCENMFYDAIDKYAADTIYMFGTNTDYSGNLGGRDGVDAICQALYDTSYGHLGAHNVRAFINITFEDQISNMPDNFGVPDNAPIVGPTGTIIDNSWEELLDGSIQNTLEDAGVFPIVGFLYWTGDNGSAKGIFDPTMSCSGWKSTIPGNARVGDFTVKSVDWLAAGGINPCNVSRRILCIAW